MTKIIVHLTEEDGTVLDTFEINCENAIRCSQDVREQIEWKFEPKDDLEALEEVS
jgi:hypothetical protein